MIAFLSNARVGTLSSATGAPRAAAWRGHFRLKVLASPDHLRLLNTFLQLALRVLALKPLLLPVSHSRIKIL